MFFFFPSTNKEYDNTMCGRRKRDASIVAALCTMCLLKAAANGQTEPTIPATGDVRNPTFAPATTAQRNDDIAGNAELLKQVNGQTQSLEYNKTIDSMFQSVSNAHILIVR